MLETVIRNDHIPDERYRELDVKRGLRDLDGRGVITGLTNISDVISFKEENGERIPIDGELWYRGYNVRNLVKKYTETGFGYENLAYLLLFGEMASPEQAKEFVSLLEGSRDLPTNFTRDVIMKAPTQDIMSSMTRSILTLASYDKRALETDLQNVIRQCLNLIAVFPMLAIYAYHAYNHYENLESMYIHRPEEGRSTAEQILMMLRPDKSCTEVEARVLDAALMLHMEHGGGTAWSRLPDRILTRRSRPRCRPSRAPATAAPTSRSSR